MPTFLDRMGDEGLLDSYDIVTFVAEAEERLGIIIDGENVLPKYFRSLDDLTSLCSYSRRE